jgi:nucleotide-binding universal stress UspA family protein
MNGIRSILVHLDGSPACALRLATASTLARQHGAEVHALFAVTSMLTLAPYDFPPGADFSLLMTEYDRERCAAAKTLFDAQAGSGVQQHWHEADGEPIWAVSQAALCHDLLVLGQRDAAMQGQVPGDFVESVIIASGKPALVLPYIASTPAACRVALVAWKSSREAARALSDALPLLARAEQVHVVAWPEHDGADGTGADPLAFLRSHGIEARRHLHPPLAGRATREVGELLLSLASDLDADLLVMGCYGHGRAREWVLGGASRTLLSSMTIPLLMSH